MSATVAIIAAFIIALLPFVVGTIQARKRRREIAEREDARRRAPKLPAYIPDLGPASATVVEFKSREAQAAEANDPWAHVKMRKGA